MKTICSFTVGILLCLTLSTSIYAQSPTTLTAKVKGITCSTDLTMIKNNVEKLEGVSECEIGKEGATAHFNITYDPQTTDKDKIYAAIEGTGGCENPDERPYKVKGKK